MEEALRIAPPKIIKENIAFWRFVPTGGFRVNGRYADTHVGELIWDDPTWETGPAIQARDWVFCLQRSLLIPNSKWFLCAYHENQFYAFLEFVEPGPSTALRRSFMGMTVACFWPYLHPEIFDQGTDRFTAAKEGRIDVVSNLAPGQLALLMKFALCGGKKKQGN